MANFREFGVEIQDEKSRGTEHFNGTANTTGTLISTTSGNPIQLVSIYVPTGGPNANDPGAILLVSWDGTNYTSFPRGSAEMWPGKGYGSSENQIHVKAYADTVKYEIKIIS